jgi:hypothetical protein
VDNVDALSGQRLGDDVLSLAAEDGAAGSIGVLEPSVQRPDRLADQIGARIFIGVAGLGGAEPDPSAGPTGGVVVREIGRHVRLGHRVLDPLGDHPRAPAPAAGEGYADRL